MDGELPVGYLALTQTHNQMTDCAVTSQIKSSLHRARDVLMRVILNSAISTQN